MTDHQDIIIIGAGVIGLSIAKHLSENGRDVLLLEKEKHFGMATSSRNSEVIHAGLYFAPDWLKTKEMLFRCTGSNRGELESKSTIVLASPSAVACARVSYLYAYYQLIIS